MDLNHHWYIYLHYHRITVQSKKIIAIIFNLEACPVSWIVFLIKATAACKFTVMHLVHNDLIKTIRYITNFFFCSDISNQPLRCSYVNNNIQPTEILHLFCNSSSILNKIFLTGVTSTPIL